MRVKGATLQQFLMAAALVMALCWNLARASEIKDLTLTQGATGTRAEVHLDLPAEYSILSLSGPDRLVLDLPSSALARGFDAPAGVGMVRAVRTGQPVAGTTRIVFDLAAPVMALKPRIESASQGYRLVLEWPGDGGSNANAAAAVAGTHPGAANPAPPGSCSTWPRP